MEEFSYPPTQSGNKFIRFRTAYELVEHWKFFREACDGLNDPHGARRNYSIEYFFNMLTRVCLMEEKGLVLMLTSKNGKPLGCGVAFGAQNFDFENCFYVWATYTNGRCPTALKELLHYAEAYARHLGFDAIKMGTPRINGASFRVFENKLGFKRDFIAFTKSI
jgi:hypothetical protein